VAAGHRLRRRENWGYTPKCVDLQAGNASNKVMCGRGGSDVLRGLGGDDTLLGDRCRQRAGLAGPRAAVAAASGKDHLFGGWGDDRLFGGPRADRLHGGPGRDLVHAGHGRDLLRSGSGNDILLVRDGARDHVTCGKGQDMADRRDRLAGCERVRFGRLGRVRGSAQRVIGLDRYPRGQWRVGR
jgi:Ca2+-binding RTX toxin-like protein